MATDHYSPPTLYSVKSKDIHSAKQSPDRMDVGGSPKRLKLKVYDTTPQTSSSQFNDPSSDSSNYMHVSSGGLSDSTTSSLSSPLWRPHSPLSQDPVGDRRLPLTSPEAAFYAYERQLDSRMCQVCGDKAAGFHQGAYVCEACKKFFIRHSTSKPVISTPCPSRSQCVIGQQNRSKCQQCRYRKCLEAGMKSKEASNEDFSITNIPCRVCGCRSSGFHFGAVTCEGCKGFFRRTEPMAGSLRCVGENNCRVTSKCRNSCKSCRYRKCLQVGMSKKGSRIGRQPNAVKFQCAKEIDYLRNLNQRELIVNNVSLMSSPNSSESDRMGADSPISTTNHNSVTDEFCPGIKHESSIGSFSVDSIPTELMQEFSLFKSEMMKSVVHWEEMKKVLRSKFALMTIPSTGAISMEDAWEPMMNHFTYHSQVIVAFAKRIPGFSCLPLDVKRQLIRFSMYPVMLVNLSEHFHPGPPTEDYNYFDFSKEEHRIILEIFPTFNVIVDHLRESGRHLHSLHLDSLEMDLVNCIIIFKNFDCLDDKYSCRKLYLFVTRMLYEYVIAKRSPADWSKFSALGPMLEAMNMQHHHIISTLKTQQPDLNFPDLYVEMFQMTDDHSSDTFSPRNRVEHESCLSSPSTDSLCLTTIEDR